MPLRLEFAASTDIGLRRRENQDRQVTLPALGLFAVADGMGGLPNGSDAAEATLAALTRALHEAPPASAEAWCQLVHAINREVVLLGRRLSPRTGIGSTLTVLHAVGDHATVAHVGDSAAFRWRAGTWAQLTTEHTVGARARRRRAAGLLDEDEGESDHILTSCIGTLPLEEIEILTTELRAGDRYLLCSDGITTPVPSDELQQVLARAASPQQAAAALIAQANQCGGPDNSTAVVVFCRE